MIFGQNYGVRGSYGQSGALARRSFRHLALSCYGFDGEITPRTLDYSDGLLVLQR